MKTLVHLALLTCAFALTAASHAAAQTYNFTLGGPGYTYGGNNSDYPVSTPVGTPYGISSIPGTSGDFNQINDYGSNGDTTFTGMEDSSGSTAAGVSISLDGFQHSDSAYQNYDPSESGDSNNFDSGLFGHFAFNFGYDGSAPATSTITLQNLTPNSVYEVALYGYNGNGETGQEGRDFNVEALGSSTSYLLEDTAAAGFESTLDTANSTATSLEFIGNYLTLEGTTDSNGTLTLDFTPISPSYQTDDIAAIQVSYVPEPSTWALLGLGGLAFLAVRHRRRAC